MNLTLSRTERAVAVALFSSLALVLNLAESAFPLPLPGVRLGLSNVFSLSALMLLGPASAVWVSALRAVMALTITGNFFAFACTVAGLICSLPVTFLLYRSFRHLFSIEAISVAGAAAFNAGQLIAVVLLLRAPALIAYFPVLAISALVSGLAVGTAARTLAAKAPLFTRRRGREPESDGLAGLCAPLGSSIPEEADE